jgi:hypothetical protein
MGRPSQMPSLSSRRGNHRPSAPKLHAYSKEVWQLALGLQTNTIALPQETNILLQNWNSLCPFQTEKKRAKSPPFGEPSQNSYSGRFGLNEITGYLGSQKQAQLKLQPR